MQSSTTIVDGTIRPQPETISGTLPQKTPGSPATTTVAAPDDETQGGSFVSTTDPEVKDFGWNSEPKAVPSPLVHGLSNDDLYTLVRRFNKQIFHVKAVDDVPGLLDLEVSEDEEFSPDKLRATLERLYMTVIVGVAAGAKHIARLRSWNEPRRTAGFALAYFFAWLFNFILPTVLVTAAALVLDPSTRNLLFPPAPLAIVSATSGNLQTPKAGTVGSKDSLSGAPEAHKGEAVEQEARHFVAGLGSVAISTAVGKGPGEDGNGNAVGGGEAEAEGVDKQASAIDGATPDPTAIATDSVAAKSLASGDNAAKDPAKVPVEQAMWSKTRPIMRALNDVVDTWERLGNALSPTHPFPYWEPRLKLAGPILVAALVTYFINMAFVLRIVTFVIGIVIFGQPLLVRGLCLLTEKVPNWKDYLELRRTLLNGVPTNAQITLTLLRLAERNKAPLPPPPTSEDYTVTDSADSADEFDGSSYDVDYDPEAQAPDELDEADSEEGSKKKKPGHRIVGALKRTVKAGVGGALGVDHLKAKVGSEAAKQRVGAVGAPPLTDTVQEDSSKNEKSGSGMSTADASTQLPNANRPDVARLNLPGGEGPCVFSARLHGRKGHAVIVNSAASPCIAFAYTKLAKSFLASIVPGRLAKPEETDMDIHPEFTVGIEDIVELRKVGGYGWKSKLVIGWATGREVLDGLEVVDSKGRKVVLTAIKGRDEVFNRLISMGNHKWESM
ncbi:hypothetical protein PHLGIDRAFT_22447 [Phlebiopsis gigantea 11061_1 CR5-6]|uniref:Uncharacterized protein n=1 Tax=Phlebiopsis gigantea (strain 11061_1 CR5-6) TaxID=745531 RepID=A0A0C3S3F4_PHLG1|nr:hypothetical protein PHLGIDRAFT_22447 [Phlebiopsis gigantea 11061_1 CR5-6]